VSAADEPRNREQCAEIYGYQRDNEDAVHDCSSGAVSVFVVVIT
jgi:hypothetical protein